MSDNLKLKTESIHWPVTSGGKNVNNKIKTGKMSPASKGFTELACQPLGYGRGHVQSRGNCNKLVGWKTHAKKG